MNILGFFMEEFSWWSQWSFIWDLRSLKTHTNSHLFVVFFKIYEVMADADGVVSCGEKCCKAVFWLLRALVWLVDLGQKNIQKRIKSYSIHFFKGIFYAVYPKFDNRKDTLCKNYSMWIAFTILTIKLVSYIANQNLYPYFFL